MKSRVITKTLIASLVAGTMLFGDVGIAVAKETSAVESVFEDIDENGWYLEYVQYVFDNKLMEGYDGQFKPSVNVTKAEVAQILYNMSGETDYRNWDACTELKDVVWDEWYTDAVCWAYDNGIITGNLDSKKFYPHSEVTREQMVLMFYRYAKYKNLDTTQTNDLSGFLNAEGVSTWSEAAVRWAVEVGLLGGVEICENGEVLAYDLAPQGSASRAQIAAIIMRFLEEPKVQQPAKPGTENDDEVVEQEEGRWLFEINDDNTVTIIDYDGGPLKGDVVLPRKIYGYTVSAVGEEALANMKMNSLTIPKEIKTIGSRAFAECSCLKTIIIESGAVEIAKDAFKKPQFIYFDITEKVVFLTDASGMSAWAESGVFQNLNAKFLYPSGDESWTEEAQESIGSKGTWEVYQTAEDASGIQWIYQEKEDNTASLLGYLGCLPTKDIKIPEQLSGMTVSEIAEKTFSNTNIESIVVPETITKIGEEAFRECGQLKKACILGNVGEIAKLLFEDCWNLESVELPNGITAIGDDAFGFCSKLKSIEIPDSVLRIGDGAFHDCLQLESVKLPENLQEMGAEIFRCDHFLEEIVIPATITEIKQEAFYSCQSLKNIVLPEGIETIGKGAFEYCVTVNKIEIPQSVKNISESAFANCRRLNQIKFHGDAPAIEEDAFYDVESMVYYSDKKEGWSEKKGQNYGGTLTWMNFYETETADGLMWRYSINEDNNITLVGYVGEEPLTELIIPTELDGKSVTAIAPVAFAKMDSLTDVTIPEQITNIGERAFFGCENLKNVNIQSSLTVLNAELFANCTSLEKFVIPELVVTLESGLFSECTGLETVEMPSSVRTIGEDAFYRCSNLKNVEIPNGVTSIENYAFAYCCELEQISLPDTITSLENNVFIWCENLEQVKLPMNMTELPNEFFYECSSLQEIEIPETVEKIGERVFVRCYGLKEVTIPKNVKEIGIGAFLQCENLQKVTFKGSAPKVKFVVDETIFGGVNAEIYYPGNDQTWSEMTFYDFGGVNLTWIAVSEE